MLEEIRYADVACDDDDESGEGKRQATRGFCRRRRGFGGGIKDSLIVLDLSGRLHDAALVLGPVSRIPIAERASISCAPSVR